MQRDHVITLINAGVALNATVFLRARIRGWPFQGVFLENPPWPFFLFEVRGWIRLKSFPIVGSQKRMDYEDYEEN